MNVLSLLAQTGSNDIETNINSFNINSVLLASLILITLILISSVVIKNEKHNKFKKPLFIGIAVTIIIPTLLMTGSSIYLNTVSDSKGPVHWHTDIEFWVCDEEIELRDPTGTLSNKIGTSSYHEHDDKRIHLEGVVLEKEYDASLEKFMAVTGGEITDTTLTIATEDSIFEDDFDGDKNSGDKDLVREYMKRDSDQKATLSVSNGSSCGNNKTNTEVQAFLFTFNKNDDTYTQTKLESPKAYTMRDESIVPPGDCLIVEFGSVKDYTERLCQQYGVKDSKRCVDFGVENYSPDLCNIREVREQNTIDLNDQIPFNPEDYLGEIQEAEEL